MRGEEGSGDRRERAPSHLRSGAARPARLLRRSLAGLLLAGPGLAAAADAQITSLVDNPDPVVAGAVVEYTARVDNNAADAALNVRLRFTVPAGATFVSATPPAGGTCAPQSPAVVECTLGTVPALGAAPKDVVLRWRALGPGPATLAASAEVLSDNDVNGGNNTQAQTTTVANGANLALTKSDTPDPVVGGANVTYTLTVANAGPNAAGSLRIVDTLSPSTSFVSASGAGWTCGHSGGTVTCTRAGPHAVGAAIPAVSIVAQVNAAGGTVTNTASVSPGTPGGVPDPDSADNTATADTAVLPGADVRIAQKVVTSTLPAIAGSNVSFRIEPRNGGPAAATGVTVSDPLPAGWTFVSASGPGWACSHAAGTVTCTRASLAAGATDDITIVAQAPGNGAVGPTGTTYTNTATATATSTDPDATNNAGSVNVNVLPDGADLRLAKSKTPDPVAQGFALTSTITVTNNGPRTATGPLRVLEQLTGETFVSGTGTGWTCSAAAGLVTCNHANAGGLAINAALPELTITTTATAAGAASNQACTGGSTPGAGTASPPAEGDPNPTNDCVTVTSNSTTTRPNLGITKATSTPTGGDKTVSTSESSVTYTLVVTNTSAAGTEPATGITIDDTVPGWINGRSSITTPVSVVAAGGATATFGCAVTAASGRVLCTQSGGTLTGGQSVTVTIVANRPLQDGTFTNTATVFNTAEGDPNAANNSASDTVTIAPIADVEMTGKSPTPASVRAGEESTYVLSFRNNGPSPAAAVTVSDTFTFAPGDAGLTVISIASSKAGSTCGIAAQAQITPAAPAFNCTIGTLANGETQTITLVVRPNWQPGNAVRSFANLARIDTTSVENPAGGDNGNNERTATLAVQPAAVDLLVNKTDRVGAVNLDPIGYDAGNTFLSYQLAVTNTGPSFATGVTITEAMTPPAGRRVRFVCDTTTFGGSTCNPAPLCTGAGATSAPGAALPAFTCTVPAGDLTTGPATGALAVGQTKNVFLRFEVLDQPAATGDVFNNLATVAGNEPDTLASNDSEGEATTTRQRIDLRTSKTASVTAPSLWQPFNWIVTVVNNGPGQSLQTDLTDTLPAGAAVTGPIAWTRTLPAGSGTCSVAGVTVTCGLGQLNAGGSATVTIPVRFTSYPAGGTAINSASVDIDPIKTGGIDTPGGNNTGTSTVNVTRSSIAGTVFDDRDRTGNGGANGGTPQAPGAEPRIAGVSIRLTGTDAYGNAVDRTVTTDASGNYLFNDLAPSNAAGYTVTETQPAGYAHSPAAPPTSGGAAPSAGGTYAAGGTPAASSSYSGIVLPAATAATQYHFPEVRAPSLSGFVYIDVDGNGVRNVGPDQPIPGATVRLLNATTGAVVATATTDAGGAYTFTGLDPFIAYTLEEPLPTSVPNLVNGAVNPGLVGGAACASGCTAQPNTPAADTDRIAAIDLSSTQDGTLFNFGERQQAAIRGVVYSDRNGNNLRDAAGTDGRIGGVTLTLHQGADCTAPQVATTTSAADGSYAFTSTTAGLTYTVCEAQPAGYGDGATNPGTNGASAAPNRITITNLPQAGSSNNDFGERAAAIAGTVYLDGNNNGAQNGGEAGIPGVVMTLTGSDVSGAPVNRTATTDASGNWRFDDLPAAGPGGYTVTEQATQPVVTSPVAATTLNGRTTAGGGGGTATPVTTVPSAINAIPLAAGATSTGHLFGELLPGSIAGTVFVDVNNDGNQQAPGDTGLAGVTLVLTGTDDLGRPVNVTVVTGPDGRYAFDGLRPGNYTVTQPNQPAGTGNGRTIAGSTGGTATPPTTSPSAITGIVLGPGGTASTGNNFAEIPANGAIEGRVWLDADNDGLIGTGSAGAAEAGIAGVTIELAGTDAAGNAVARSTTTDGEGRFSFTQLPPGTYTVREPAQPAGTANGTTRAGQINTTPSGTATPVTTLPSSVGGITLGVGETSRDNLFGEIPAASIAGRVFADDDNDGAIGAAEAGIAGVTLVLTGTDDLGRPVNVTVVTGPDGRYVFDGLRPGTYTVTEPTQPPGTVNGITRAGSAGGSASPVTQPASSIAGIVLVLGTQATANDFGEISNSPDLRVTKAALAEPWTVTKTGTYRITVRNAGESATSGAVTVRDRLPAGMTLAATPAGSGWACSGAAGDSLFSCTTSAPLAAGATLPATIDAVVNVGAAAAQGSADNRVLVEGGGEIAARAPSPAERNAFDAAAGSGGAAALSVCTAAIEHNACRLPTRVQLAAAVSGTVWFDTGVSRGVLDGADRRLPGWTVQVVDAQGNVVASTTTGSDGRYSIVDLVPGVPYTVRFRDPGTSAVFGYPVNGETAPGSSGATCDAQAAAAGRASSCVGSGANPFLSVVLAPGQTLVQQSLPVDPSGVVYDSALRQPVPGSVVTLAPSGPSGTCAGWDPATGIVGATLGGYRISGSAISVTVGADGLYQFFFTPGAPASCTFTITVTAPAGYTSPSGTIPPAAGPLVPPGGAGSTFAVQPQAGPPTASPGPATTYYLEFTGGSAGANIVHNHVPLDPQRATAVTLLKTGDRAAAEIGDSVRYTVTVDAPAGPRPIQTTVVDRLPAGFTYIRGTATVNDRRIADPTGANGGVGPTLAFNLGPMPASGALVLRYRVRVGVGAAQGDGVNRAQAFSCGTPEGCTGAAFAPQAAHVASNFSSFKVRVSGGVFGTDACVLGKIFVDCNHNHVQDREELGIPGVRFVMSDGTTLVSDSEGKYSVCGVTPRSHVLKADPLTLPRGSRLVTSSNRNLGDAGSLWLDVKNGELHRADFIEGSCSNTVLEQVKARRAQGEVRAPEPEKAGRPALRFDSKAHGLSTLTSPAQGTDGANQRAPKPRAAAPATPATPTSGSGGPKDPASDETHKPTPALPMNRPAPKGRDSGTAPDAPAKSDRGGSDGAN